MCASGLSTATTVFQVNVLAHTASCSQVSLGCVPHLQIGGYYGNTGTATLAVAVLGAPLNDDFSNRVWLTNTTDFVIGSNIQASVEPNEPEHYGVGASVWYAFQAPALGTATISIPCKFC